MASRLDLSWDKPVKLDFFVPFMRQHFRDVPVRLQTRDEDTSEPHTQIKNIPQAKSGTSLEPK